jgi:hypothetical protein
MSYSESFLLLVMGGIFVGVGIGVLFWGKREEKRDSDTLAARTDMKEFLEYSPEHSRSRALKLGGWISIILGLVMLGIEGGSRLWG